MCKERETEREKHFPTRSFVIIHMLPQCADTSKLQMNVSSPYYSVLGVDKPCLFEYNWKCTCNCTRNCNRRFYRYCNRNRNGNHNRNWHYNCNRKRNCKVTVTIIAVLAFLNNPSARDGASRPLQVRGHHEGIRQDHGAEKLWRKDSGRDGGGPPRGEHDLGTLHLHPGLSR